ncbi:MAG: hypothetical protein LBT54_07875 [Bifidobacteriaceae bacterium]|nr:hypothetical protein [Bifidobacteriaceae bacterium]
MDLVLEFEDGHVFGIEVKAAQSVNPAHFKSLRGPGARLGQRFGGGLVLGMGERGVQVGRREWRLPIAALRQAG